MLFPSAGSLIWVWVSQSLLLLALLLPFAMYHMGKRVDSQLIDIKEEIQNGNTSEEAQTSPTTSKGVLVGAEKLDHSIILSTILGCNDNDGCIDFGMLKLNML